MTSGTVHQAHPYPGNTWATKSLQVSESMDDIRLVFFPLVLNDRLNQVPFVKRFSWHLKLKYSLLHFRVNKCALQNTDIELSFIFYPCVQLQKGTLTGRGFSCFLFIYVFICSSIHSHILKRQYSFNLCIADKINYCSADNST